MSLSLSCIFSGAVICSFFWAIVLSWRACYVVRGGALGVHQGGETRFVELWCCMWERGPRGKSAACSTLHWFSVISSATHNQIGPFWCWFLGGWICVHSRTCGSLQRTLLWGWEFLLLLPQPPQVFSVRGFQALFPGTGTLGCASVSLPSCSSQFICTQMWDPQVRQPWPHWVRQLVLQPLPCSESSPPSCLSPPLLPVWMNVSCLTPWLLDFHTVRFSGSSGCFLFLNLFLSFFCLSEESVYLPIPPSWPEVPVLRVLCSIISLNYINNFEGES